MIGERPLLAYEMLTIMYRLSCTASTLFLHTKEGLHIDGHVLSYVGSGSQNSRLGRLYIDPISRLVEVETDRHIFSV